MGVLALEVLLLAGLGHLGRGELGGDTFRLLGGQFRIDLVIGVFPG